MHRVKKSIRIFKLFHLRKYKAYYYQGLILTISQWLCLLEPHAVCKASKR